MLFLATCTVLPVCSLHVCMIIDLSFLLYYPGTSEFYVGTGPGMPGCSYATDARPTFHTQGGVVH